MNQFEKEIKEKLMKNLSYKSKSSLRSNLMESIDSVSFAEKLSVKIRDLSLPWREKVILKEKLFYVLEEQLSFWKKFLRVFQFTSKIFVGTLASLLVIMLIIQPFGEPQLARASSTNRIHSFYGEVVVYRDGLSHELKENLLIKKGDLLKTREGSGATIVFSDNSLLRMSENTELLIEDLNRESLSLEVDMYLEKGKVWNNLIGLKRGGANFNFRTSELKGNVKTAAIFDLEAKKSYSRVVNFDKEIVLTVPTDEGLEDLALSKGDLLKISADLYEVDLDEALQEQDLDWIRYNLQKDLDYNEELLDNLLQERKDVAGTVPGSIFYPVEEFGRSAKLAVTLDPIKKDKIKLEIANEKLLEAEVLLQEGKDATELLEDYNDTIVEVAENIDNMKEESLEDADALNQDLKLVLENHALDLELKEAVEEVASVKEAVQEAKDVVEEIQEKSLEETEDAEDIEEEDEVLEADLDNLEQGYKVLDEKETGELLVELEAKGVKVEKFKPEDFDLSDDKELELSLPKESEFLEEGEKALEDVVVPKVEANEFRESADDEALEEEELVQKLVPPMVKK